MSDDPPRRRRLSRDDIVRMHAEAADRLAHQESVGEERKVQYLLKLFAAPRGVVAAFNAARVKTGHRLLTLDLYNKMVPGFPLLMGFTRCHARTKGGGTSTGTLPQLFRRFRDAPFVKHYAAYYEAAADLACGRVVTMLFPRDQVPHGLAVYDTDLADRYWTRGFVGVYNGGSPDKPERLYVQPFAQLAAAIRESGYRPEYVIE